MGRGCDYTNDDKSQAAWLDLFDRLDIEDEEIQADECCSAEQDAEKLLEKLGYTRCDNGYYANGLMRVKLTWEEHATLVIYTSNPWEDVEYSYQDVEYQRKSNLCEANRERMYDRILKAFNESGWELRIATSGYTSRKLFQKDAA